MQKERYEVAYNSKNELRMGISAPGRMLLRTVLLCALIVARTASVQAQRPGVQAIKEELVRMNRMMFTAMLQGDHTFFERCLADNYIETSATGKVMLRSDALAQVQPAPRSVKATFEINDARVILSGKFAILSMRSDDHEEVAGQSLVHAYRTTQVWTHLNNRWRLCAEHTSPIVHDPVPAKIDHALYDTYVGRYSVGPEYFVAITRIGERLMIQTTGDAAATELIPENETNFFSRNDPGRTVFKKDESGQVMDCIYRTADGQEIHARRLK